MRLATFPIVTLPLFSLLTDLLANCDTRPRTYGALAIWEMILWRVYSIIEHTKIPYSLLIGSSQLLKRKTASWHIQMKLSVSKYSSFSLLPDYFSGGPHNICVFKTLSLWCFAMEAQADQYRPLQLFCAFILKMKDASLRWLAFIIHLLMSINCHMHHVCIVWKY